MFETRILESVIADTYSITHEREGLLEALARLRKETSVVKLDHYQAIRHQAIRVLDIDLL